MIWNFIDDDVVRVPRSIRRQVVETVAEAASDLATADVATEWPRVKAVLVRVLSLFPEARDAFVKGIQEAFDSQREPVPQWAT
jgi:hypothetical protein